MLTMPRMNRRRLSALAVTAATSAAVAYLIHRRLPPGTGVFLAIGPDIPGTGAAVALSEDLWAEIEQRITDGQRVFPPLVVPPGGPVPMPAWPAPYVGDVPPHTPQQGWWSSWTTSTTDAGEQAP